MGSGFYVCARQRTRWPRGSMVCCSKFFRKSHAFELVATDLAGFEPNSRKGVIPVIPISCRMRSSGKKIGKEGHTREIRQPLVLIRFALNLNKENSIVATRERGFESLRPDHRINDLQEISTASKMHCSGYCSGWLSFPLTPGVLAVVYCVVLGSSFGI